MDSVTNSSSMIDRINNTIINIEGVMNNLKSIMDEKGYYELEKEYIILKNKVPKNTILTQNEKEFGTFGFDYEYIDLDKEVREFEKKLYSYNGFKKINDDKNELLNSTREVFIDASSVSDYIEKCKNLVNSLENNKDDIHIQQFTKLYSKSLDALYTSLKVLSFIDNDELVNYINSLNSDLLRENIGSRIRKNIDVTSKRGDLDDDYVDYNTICACATNDEEIGFLISSAKQYIETQKKFVEELGEKEVKLDQINSQKRKLNFQKVLLNGLLVSSMLLPYLVPLSCPIIGIGIGRKKSNEIKLTKTVTNYVDIDNNKVISSSEDYIEKQTRYIASVIICDPWKKSLTGASYTRVCTVYDYELTEEELLNENFHLNKRNIDESRLVKKYSYDQNSPDKPELKYFYESQMFMTETYQIPSIQKNSNKYMTPSILISLGVAIGISTGEILLYNGELNEVVRLQLKECTNEKEKIEEEEKRINASIKSLRKSIK